jgi:hypothetical protein
MRLSDRWQADAAPNPFQIADASSMDAAATRRAPSASVASFVVAAA